MTYSQFVYVDSEAVCALCPLLLVVGREVGLLIAVVVRFYRKTSFCSLDILPYFGWLYRKLMVMGDGVAEMVRYVCNYLII